MKVQCACGARGYAFRQDTKEWQCPCCKRKQLTQEEQIILKEIETKTTVTIFHIARVTKHSRDTAKDRLCELETKGRIKREGQNWCLL